LAKKFEQILALPASDDAKEDRQFVTALARGLEFLRAFEPGDGLLGNQELAERTGLPKPTISRIAHTLTKLGYLEYDRRLEKYRLGTPVLALGYACLANIGIRSIAKPHMHDLAEHANASVALGSRDRLHMTYLELAHGHKTVALRLDVGARIPIHRSAMGAAFLFALPETEQEFLLDAIRKLEGNNWPSTRKHIRDQFAQLESKGFCVSLGTFERTINGVGAPLVSRDETTVYAVNCSGPAFLLSADRLTDEIGPMLLQTVSNIRSDMVRQQIRF
jgi:DNA-binding IclR family transcriptional regulator